MYVLQIIATYLTMILGIGVLLIGIYYVWEFVVRLLLAFFKIHALFRQFIFDQQRKKKTVYSPTLNKEESE